MSGIGVSVDGRGVATVTVDNPGRANCLDSGLMDGLAGAFEGLAGEVGLRAVVLTGAGERAFIGGADIGEMVGLDPASARAFIGRVHRCCLAIRDVPVPVIARIGGNVFGAGLEIAAACDLRLAAAHARFGMPEVRLGIPSVVEAALLPMLVGWGRTREMLLLGETFGAAEAASWGLVERTAPGSGLDAALEGWIGALLACRPGAVRLQKALIREWEDLPLREAIAAGVDSFAAAFRGDEPRVAMEGFLAGRRAVRQDGLDPVVK